MSPSDSTSKVTAVESELGRAAALVSEIVGNREGGNFDTLLGNGDDDLYGAIEDMLGAAKEAIRTWRR